MTEEEIQVLIEMNEDVWDSYLPYLSAQVQQQLALGSFTGLTAQEVVANITDATLSPAQVQTLITTSLNNYSRSITTSIMEEEPDDTLYWYIGPVDGRTRDICLQQVASGKLTQKEILNNLVFVDCGYIWHFNGFDKSMRTPIMKKTWDSIKKNYEN